MDSYYSPPSYYYEPSCPIHDSYIDPYSSYYYHPTQIVHYNNSTPNNYAQPMPPVQVNHSTPILNTTFESSMDSLVLINKNIYCCFSSINKSSSSSSTYNIYKRSS